MVFFIEGFPKSHLSNTFKLLTLILKEIQFKSRNNPEQKMDSYQLSY